MKEIKAILLSSSAGRIASTSADARMTPLDGAAAVVTESVSGNVAASSSSDVHHALPNPSDAVMNGMNNNSSISISKNNDKKHNETDIDTHERNFNTNDDEMKDDEDSMHEVDHVTNPGTTDDNVSEECG